MARTKKKSNYELLQEHAATGNLIVRRWSPGDGITRYRFFDRKEVARVMKLQRARSASVVAEVQTYNGPANGVCTALGSKAAWKFLQTGSCPRGKR